MRAVVSQSRDNEMLAKRDESINVITGMGKYMDITDFIVNNANLFEVTHKLSVQI